MNLLTSTDCNMIDFSAGLQGVEGFERVYIFPVIFIGLWHWAVDIEGSQWGLSQCI